MIRAFICILVAGFACATSAAAAAAEAAAASAAMLPRTVIALYDDRNGGPEKSFIHTMAEMPLNHLGLEVEYYNIHQPLPQIDQRKDVRGVLVWVFPDTIIEDADAYVTWAYRNIDAGKKFVFMGGPGLTPGSYKYAAGLNRMLRKIGISVTDTWLEHPFDVTYAYQTPSMFLTSRAFDWKKPSYLTAQAVSGEGNTVHLSAHQDHKDYDSDLIITGPKGGYIASNYIYREHIHNDEEVRQWMINPYEFFRLAFDTDTLPKPDTTTIAGRRIYYSHIDGDGWNNVTQIEAYHEKPTLSAKVVMDKLVKAYPDLPVTLTVIAGDVDPKWAAIKDSREVAREFYALPQVEAGSHTYSHPFYWQLFQDGNSAREIPFLNLYGQTTWKPQKDAKIPKDDIRVPSGYLVPRAYAYEPFDLKKEIDGSVEELKPLLPEGKTMSVLTWSGNCSPWEEALSMTRMAGLQNINGGDSRFDPDYPNYASIAPIGRLVGNERQIYASASNENTYTNLWSKNFFAHRYLATTLKKTESPVRLKPLNLYYHIYAGEREASLNAMLSNLNYASSQDIAPVTTSEYTKIAEGFYGTQITEMGPNSWRIDNRGELQTIRFDRHSTQSVDFQNSKGVVGQRYLQGSLYVYLDGNVEQPVIALKDNPDASEPPEEPVSYLVESRWLVSSVARKDNRVDFQAQGFGAGDMIWQVPAAGRYRVTAGGKKQELVVPKDRLLKLKLDDAALAPLHITITKV